MHMLWHGIHDVCHASLLQIHHPNDNWWFPGRLYSQIVAEPKPDHENEWAADKIISHTSSKTNSIFEVLWYPGRKKTWLAYDQVRDLNLLQPYLEVQEVSNINDLPLSTGTPPLDDTQTFLGAVQFILYKAQVTLQSISISLNLPSLSLTSAQSLVSYLNSFWMSFCSKDHYRPHPLLTMHPDGLIQLASIDPNIVVHLLQLQEYICYDNDVYHCNITINTYVPARYAEFTAT